MPAHSHFAGLDELAEEVIAANRRRSFCGWYRHCLKQAVEDRQVCRVCGLCPLTGLDLMAPHVSA